MTETVKQWIEVNGTCLRYALRRGAGDTMVLVHEMGGSLESWDDVLLGLPADAQVLCYDMRGAGLSEKLVKPCTLQTHAQDLEALLRALGINKPIVLAGIAVGAAICIRYSLNHPNQVRRLIAMAPALGVRPAIREAARQRGAAIAAEGMRGDALTLLERAYHEELRTNPPRFTRYKCRWLANDARSLGAIYQMLADTDIENELLGLPQYTLLVGGTYDPLRPPMEISRIGKLVPHAQVLHVTSGHFMSVQSPKLVARLLSDYAMENPPNAQTIYESFMSTAGHAIGSARHAA